MMKKMISLLVMVGLLVGCQSTQETVEEEVKIEVSQERYLEIINEINAEYGSANFIAKGYKSSIDQNEYITFSLYTKYIFDPLNDKREEVEVVNEMREINKKLNEKYNKEGVSITSTIIYGKEGKRMVEGKKQRCKYVIYGDNTEENEHFLR